MSLEKGYGAIESGEETKPSSEETKPSSEAKPSKSSGRRTLVALAAASVVLGATVYSAARPRQSSTNLASYCDDGNNCHNWITWDLGSWRDSACEYYIYGNKLRAKLRKGDSSVDVYINKGDKKNCNNYNWDTVTFDRNKRQQYENIEGEFKCVKKC